MPQPLILAMEKGYSTIPGIYAVDILSWADVKSIERELKKKDVKEKFKTIVFDTIDLAGALCEKYICDQSGVDKIGDIPYGGGWSALKKEFEETIRRITQYGYAVVFISHDKEEAIKDDKGNEYTAIRPSCSNSFNSIAENAADIYGYATAQRNPDGTIDRKLILRSGGLIRCGCRFKYIQPEIKLDYNSLVKAVNEAIDKEALENDNQFVTDEKVIYEETEELNYNALMKEVNNLITEIVPKDKENNPIKITQIVEKYLGKNKKVSEATPSQIELINLIVGELKELL